MKVQWKKKALNYALLALIGSLAAVIIFANITGMTYAGLITQYFGQQNYKLETGEGEEEDANYFASDYNSMAVLQEDETEFATRVQGEGAVLLKNAGLPLQKNAKITLLGSGSSDEFFLVSGGGSGAIDVSKKPPLDQVFADAGFTVNPVMLAFYADGAGRSTRGSNNYTVGEAPQSAYMQEQLDSYAAYNDAAVVILGRMGQESKDVSLYTAEDASKSMLELSQNELDLIDSAIEHFDNVVVLLNTMNPVELGPLENRDVSVLWIGAGGQQGLRAIPQLLNGSINPSGRLVDTYAYDNFSAPAMQNFGDFRFSNIESTYQKYYYNYAENIYIGYKYYETRYADKVTGTGNAGDFDYTAEVQYPFGYGLSYTSFDYSGFILEEEGDSFTAKLTVTNAGNMAGKEVVQVYMQSPYTDYDIRNKIEKSAVTLVGFDKTEVLAPGESTEVEIEISKEHMKAYDAFGKGTYIVDEGSYYFAAGKDAHDALNNILAAQGYTEADGMTAEGDASLAASCEQETFDAKTYAVGSTGASIENQFDDASYAHYEPSFTYLTRSDWVGTWPQPLGETYVGESNAGYWTMEASDEIAQGLVTPNAADDPGAKMPVTGAANGLTLASLIGVDFDSEYWDMLLDQMTAEEMMDLVGNAGFGTPLVQSVNKPATTEKDGPAGISSTLIGGVGCFGYPIAMVFASSWNLELQEEYGYYYGNDAILSRVSGIYAPSINMHRTPFSGRNFEYYSEDSFQSGMFAATFIRSVKEKGVYCYTKHFALNDQELNRDTAATFATEQTIREIYLRPFELAVRIGGSNGMMVSKNRIGTVWTGVNKNLLTDVLRGEWGFEGAVITDGLHVYSEEFNSKTALDAGLDAYLCTTKGAWEIPGYQNNASVVEDLREASLRILYNIANSLAMNNIGASTHVVPVMPPWQIVLFVADAVLGVIVAVGAVFLVRGIYKAWREER